MSWYRAAAIAFLAHILVLAVFVFTLKGNAEAYKVDVVFWGSILRHGDVMRVFRQPSTGPADVKDINMPGLMPQASLLWAKGVAIDKPDLFHAGLPFFQEEQWRFSGERAELDPPPPAILRVEADLPSSAPVKMRLDQP